ncbi:MAG: tRNA lysidine(34) synthetase TilS [Candidatus Promineifilaceae bacterium]|nr:tRNA lysidine(34) synthetase TilS [Candidatus Promineifilaceae bacterium]
MLVEQVRSFLELWAEQGVLTPDDPLVVGVSGGPDSLALLHALVVGADGSRPLHAPSKVIVGHLNHQLRDDAAEDAQFVARLCAEWKLACHVERSDVHALADDAGLSLEEAGRLARYRFLAALARRASAHAVAVGHHADDQVETVLMHLLRGSGLGGLRGMEPVAALPYGESPQEHKIHLLRPLLATPRAEIEAYCESHALRPRIDPSNSDPTFFRNRVRHELLPELETYNPQLRRAVLRTASLLAADHALLDRMAEHLWEALLLEQGEGWLRVELSGWRRADLSLRRRLLRRAVGALGGVPSEGGEGAEVGFRTTELAREVAESGDVGAQAHLPGDLLLTLEYDAWRLEAPGAIVPLRAPQLPATGAELVLAIPGIVYLAGGWRLEAALLEGVGPADVADNADDAVAFVDVGGTAKLIVRGRQPGERLRPLGMNGHSTPVKDIMINRKIPSELRERWPIVATADHPVWIAGHQMDRRVSVTSESRAVVRLRLLAPQGDEKIAEQ